MPFAFPYLKNMENENECKNEKREPSNQRQKQGSLVARWPAIFPWIGFARQSTILISGNSLNYSKATSVPKLVPKITQALLNGKGHLKVFIDANVHW